MTKRKKCYRCGSHFKPNHIKECKAINSNCLNGGKIGHFTKVCQQIVVKSVILRKFVNKKVFKLLAIKRANKAKMKTILIS